MCPSGRSSLRPRLLINPAHAVRLLIIHWLLGMQVFTVQTTQTVASQGRLETQQLLLVKNTNTVLLFILYITFENTIIFPMQC